MKTTIKDYLLIIMLGVLFGICVLESINVFLKIDQDQSFKYLIASTFLMMCLVFIITGRDKRRRNPARYDREFYNKVENYRSRY